MSKENGKIAVFCLSVGWGNPVKPKFDYRLVLPTDFRLEMCQNQQSRSLYNLQFMYHNQ